MSADEQATQSSPPTARVIRLLEHLARQPGDPRSVTQLARELGMPRATCALIVEELASLGWLARESTGFVLGAGAVPVGRAALASPAAGALARAALAALADEVGLVCTVSGLVGDNIVVLDRAGPASTQQGFEVTVGMRFPYAAPLGLMNIAWEPDAVINEWLARAASPLPSEDIEGMWAVAREVRAHGVLIERLTDHLFKLYVLLAGMAGEEVPDALRRAVGDALYPLAARDYLRRELRAGRSYPVSLIAAPVFDAGGRQRFLIAAFLADRAVPHARIMSVAERVRAAADWVTTDIGGVDPWKGKETG